MLNLWASNPSHSARIDVAEASLEKDFLSQEMSEILFKKSKTESPLENFADDDVGRVWLGPAM